MGSGVEVEGLASPYLPPSLSHQNQNRHHRDDDTGGAVLARSTQGPQTNTVRSCEFVMGAVCGSPHRGQVEPSSPSAFVMVALLYVCASNIQELARVLPGGWRGLRRRPRRALKLSEGVWKLS